MNSAQEMELDASNISLDLAHELNEDNEGEDEFAVPPPPSSAFITNADGSRLIITTIVNENFKSYAGIQILGPFHKYFSAVIGPNGSGKSNVIDSMLFVFGYRASKLRSKKISALLHDSRDHGKATSCTVTVNFASMRDIPEDALKYELVPNSEFSIARTANADNSSYYTINGKRAQFKEVNQLLGKYGIDLVHNRFLILQGEVELISLMKPKSDNKNQVGMLEYLEDIIGSSRYKVPLEKMAVRLNELTTAKDAARSMFSMALHDMNSLQGQFDIASNYIKLENEIAVLQCQLYQKKMLMTDAVILKKGEVLSNLEGQMKELAANIDLKKKELTKLEKSNKEKLTVMAKLESEKERLKAKFDAINQKDVVAQQEMERCNKKRKESRKSLASEEEKMVALKSVPAKNEKTIDDLGIKEQKLEEERQGAEKNYSEIMASLQQDTHALQEEKEKLHAELEGYMSTLNKAKAKYEMGNTELTLYTSRRDQETKKLEELKTRLETTIKSMESAKSKIVGLNEEIKSKKDVLQQQQQEANILKTEEMKVEQERRKCQLTVEEARSSMQSNKSRGRLLDGLMRGKQCGELPGIYGRLGDLGGIDPKYDVAISTASGALEYIVVDNTKTSHACIEYLKKHQLGRASFIDLQKQEHYKAVYAKRFQAPENAPRLFDLIQVPDEKFRPAFYHALRDTLVANDLPQATRIGYGAKRYRVVTLAGELIETSGTMSGGGRQVMRGRMGRTAEKVTEAVSPNVIAGMEKRLNEQTQRLGEIRSQLRALNNNIAENTLALDSKENECNTLMKELKMNERQEPSLRDAITAQELKVKENKYDPDVVKKMKEDLKIAQNDLEKASKEADDCNEKVKKVQDEILAKTKGTLDKGKKELNDITGKLEKVRQEKTKLRVAITTAARNLKRCEDRIANLTKESLAYEEKVKSLSVELKTNEVDAKEALDEFKKAEELLQNEKEGNHDYQSNLDKIIKEEAAMKSKAIDLKDEITTAKNEIDHQHSKMNSYKKSIKSLKITDQPYNNDRPELKLLTKEELEELNLNKLEANITRCQEALPNRPQLGVINEYLRKREVYLEREDVLNKASEARELAYNRLTNTKKARVFEFNTGLDIIGYNVKECYQMLAEGGDAYFEVITPADPFTDGVRFNARPPKKTWKELGFLSGGEKTIASLAIIFALHRYKPTPLYFMDEIDSALDWKNTAIVAYYLKEQTRNAQFIVISLRENMFELADQLVGIYKTENCTKSITIIPGNFGAERRRKTADNSLVPVVPSSPPSL